MKSVRTEEIKLKRAYEKPSRGDGRRILIDRIWPRGLSKEELKIDDWMKDVAPSTSLRKWFAHDPEKWQEFRKRYFRELDRKRESIEKITEQMENHNVTLVYAAKDTEHNNAVALKEYIEKQY